MAKQSPKTLFNFNPPRIVRFCHILIPSNADMAYSFFKDYEKLSRKTNSLLVINLTGLEIVPSIMP